KLYTEHLGQLTNTSLNPLAPLQMSGTDLGVSFVRDGKLAFLFGDTWPPGQSYTDDDSLATTPLTSFTAGAVPTLSWLTNAALGRFQSLAVPGVNLKGMNVPVEAVPIGNTTYVFFSTGWNGTRHTNSVLAHASQLAFGQLTL